MTVVLLRVYLFYYACPIFSIAPSHEIYLGCLALVHLDILLTTPTPTPTLTMTECLNDLLNRIQFPLNINDSL